MDAKTIVAGSLGTLMVLIAADILLFGLVMPVEEGALLTLFDAALDAFDT